MTNKISPFLKGTSSSKNNRIFSRLIILFTIVLSSIVANGQSTLTVSGINASLCFGANNTYAETGICTNIWISPFSFVVQSAGVNTWEIRNNVNSIIATGTGSTPCAATWTTGCGGTPVVTGCVAAATISASAPFVICEDNINNTLQLTGTPAGGTWSSTSPLFTLDNNGLVTGTGNGNGAGSLSYIGPSSCAPTTQIVTVNPIPVITATPVAPEHCLGDSVALTAADVTPVVTPSTQFFWSHGLPNGSFITSTNNQLYTVESNDANGCKSDPYNVTVQVNPNPTITASGNTACENDASITLSSSGTGGTGALSYEWTGPAPATTAVAPAGPSPTVGISPVTLSDAGDYTVTVTDAKTCSATATATLVVGAQPVITLVAPSTATICADGITQLATTSTGGTWASVTSTVASVDQNGLVTAQSAGTTDITYTDGNSCVGTFTVTVNAAPIISGGLAICNGFTTQLTATNTPAATMAWVSQTPAVATVDASGLVTSVSAGTTDIIYTDINSCDDTVTVTVNAVPVISGTTTICAGGTTQLSATTTGTNWTSSNILIATVDGTGLVTATTTPPGTLVTITFIDANGCTATEQVTVNPLPVFTSTVFDVCQNSTVTLAATNTPLTPIAWSSDASSIASVDNAGVVTGLLPGTTNITYTDVNGCTVTNQVVVNSLPVVLANTTAAAVCEGDQITLTGSGAVNYTWDNSVTDGNAFTPTLGSTTYTVIGSDANSCSATSSVSITVNPKPTVTAAGATICENDSVTLTSVGTLTAPTIGNINYAWSGPNSYTAGTQDITFNPVATSDDGAYTITVTDANSCSATTAVTLTVNALPVVTATATPNITCAGDMVQLVGTTYPVIDWSVPLNSITTVSDSTIANPTSNPLTTTTYTVTVTDANSCSNSASTMVTVNPVPVISGPTVSCADPLLTLQLAATNTPASTNPWVSSDPLVATVDASGLVTPVAGGSTVITYTDANGCTDNDTITINALPVVTAVAVPSEICAGDSTTLTATMTSGAGTPSWFWSHGQGNNATITPTGGSNINYTVFAIDTNACTSLPVVIGIIINPLPTVTAADQTVCDGDPVTFTAVPGGGTPGYTGYAWAGPTPTNTNTGILNPYTLSTVSLADAGGYTVTVTDSKGCKGIDTATLTVNPNPVAPTVAPIVTPICSGNDAMFTITSVAGYDVEYNFGGATMTATIGAGGTADVTDAGVTANSTINITKVTNTVTSCFSNLSAPTATVVVNSLPVVPSVTSSDSVCFGTDGIFTITGTPTDIVDYNIIGAIPSSGSATIGAGGTVDVTVTAITSTTVINLTKVSDASSSCFRNLTPVITATITINALPVATVSTTTPASCVPGCDGTATINVTGGLPLYNYTVSGAASMSANMVQGICAGSTYTVTVADQNSCTTTLTTTGVVSPDPTVMATGDVICFNDAATFTATGTNTAPTTGAFTYVWSGTFSPIANATSFIPLALTDAGTYSVIAKDAQGCTAMTTVTLVINDLPSVTATSVTSPSCNPGCDGTATAMGTASTSPGSGPAFTYAVNGGATAVGNALSALCAAPYIVTVTDGNSCTATTTLSMTTATGPSITVNDTTICDGGTAAFTATVTPGTAAITSVVYTSPVTSALTVTDGVAFSPVLSDAGTYTVTVTDANGCTAQAFGLLTINPNPTITGSFTICGGDIESLTGSGTPATSMPWMSSNTAIASVDNNGLVTATLMAGTTDITYTDINGCNTTQTITVNAKPVIGGQTVVCRNANIFLAASGIPGATPWTSQNNAVATVTSAGVVTGVAAGSVDIIFTDNNGCTDTFAVTVNPLPEIIATALPFELCAGDTTIVTAMNTATSPSTAINFFWSHSGPNPSQQSPAFNTIYFVFGSDANGCSSSSVSQLVLVNQPPTITASSVTICDGDLATLTATGANTFPTMGPLTFNWSGGVGAYTPITNGVAFSPLLSQAGVYTATATDSKGCTNTTSVNLFIDTLPTAPTLTSNSPVCDGDDAIFTLSGVMGDVVTYTINGGTPTTTTIGTGGTVDVTVTSVSTDQTILLSQVQSPTTTCVTPLSATMTVTVQPLPTAATVAGASPICDGDNAVFTLSGTAADIVTYTINGSLPATATIGALGTVDVTVTAASIDQTILLSQVSDGSTGCITPLTATTTITVNPNPVAATVASNSPICDGQDAIFTITGTASDIVTYTINAGTPTTATIGALGTVDVTVAVASVDQTIALTEVQDATTLCTTALTATTTVTVNPNPVAVTMASNSPICDGDDAIFTISGTATDIVSYSINSGTPTTATIGALGTVDVTVTAASVDQTMTLSQVQDATTNCTTALTASMTVTVNPNPVAVTIASNTPACSGSDAVFTLTGTANDVVTYTINGGAATTATIGAGGTVDVTVTGVTVAQTIALSQVQATTGCTTALTSTSTVTISPLPAISGNTVVCLNLPIQLSATNLPATTAAWMSSNTSIATVDNSGLVSTLGSGTVDVTYTDINGCTDVISITVNPLPIITTTATPFEICYGDSSQLTASSAPSSPTTALNFFWTHGLVNGSYLSPVANTTYFVFGTDANGCSSTSITQLIQVNQLPGITASDVTICAGASATLTAVGTNTTPTTGALGYSWSGTFTPVTNGVAFIPAVADSGPYTATVTDSKGCENSTTVNLTVNPLPTPPTISTNSPTCVGGNAVFTLTGTVGDLVSYTINGTGAAIATIGTGGTIDITVTGVSVDQTILLSQVQSGTSGCVSSLSASSTVTVNPTLVAATVVGNSPICDGADAIFTISGTATDIVTYTINGGTPTTATIGPLGTVDVTVTAASVDQTIALTQVQNATFNCTSILTATTTVIVNALPTVIANTSAQTICAGDSVTLTGSGASTYAWDNSVVDGTAFALATTTTYTVIGTDLNGCSATSTVSIAVDTLPVVVANTTDTAVCAGDMLTLTGSGTATSYTWDNSVVDGIAFAPAATTTFTVTGTGGNGCSATDTVTVTVNALPSVVANATATAICTGDMVALAGGGAASYTWDNSVVDATPFTPAATNTYTVTGTDALGCSATSSVTVTVNAIPVAPTVGVIHPSCATANGTINVSAPLGANYEYSIDGINYQSSPTFSAAAGVYNVTVRDTAAIVCPSLATTDTLNASLTPCGPNIAVGAQSLPTSIAEGGTATINYFVSNVGTAPTSGVINIIISKPTNGTLTFSPPAGWTITLNTSGSVFLTSTGVIQPGLINRVTIPAIYVHDNTNEDAVKSSNIKAQAGSGGEFVTNDNEGQTFLQIN